MAEQDEVEGPADAQVLKFTIRFKLGQKTIALIEGTPRAFGLFKVGDVTDKIVDAEQYLERLTGYRVHIETAEE